MGSVHQPVELVIGILIGVAVPVGLADGIAHQVVLGAVAVPLGIRHPGQAGHGVVAVGSGFLQGIGGGGQPAPKRNSRAGFTRPGATKYRGYMYKTPFPWILRRCSTNCFIA